MPIWQLCANLLIPNCLRSNLSYSPLAALELYVNEAKLRFYTNITHELRTPIFLITAPLEELMTEKNG